MLGKLARHCSHGASDDFLADAENSQDLERCFLCVGGGFRSIHGAAIEAANDGQQQGHLSGGRKDEDATVILAIAQTSLLRSSPGKQLR